MHRRIATFLVLATVACGPASDKTQTLRIALPLPYSGAMASLGFNIERAVVLATNLVNDSGGVAGAKLEVVQYNTHSDLLHGYAVAQTIIDDGHFAIIGPDSAALLGDLQPKALQQGLLLVTPSETSALPGEPFPASAELWAQLNPVVGLTSAAVANRIFKAGLKKVAFCYINDGYGQSYLRTFADTYLPLGGNVSGLAFQPNMGVNTQQVQQILAFSPDALLVITPPDLAADIVNNTFIAAKNQQVKAPALFLGPNLESIVFSRSAIAPAVQGSSGFASTTADPGNAFSSYFSESWYGEIPTPPAYYYYDAIAYLALNIQAAARDAGQTPSALQVWEKMLTAASDANATATTWNTFHSLLPQLKAGQTIRYQGVTGLIQLDSHGIRAEPSAYTPAPWMP